MFQNLKISKSFTMLKWGCNLHDIYIKIVIYDARNKNLKQLAYFSMIQNYDILKDETKKSSKI